MIPMLAAMVVTLLAAAIGAALLPSAVALPRSRWEGFSLSLVLGLAVVAVVGTAMLASGMSIIPIEWTFLASGLLALAVLSRRDRLPSSGGWFGDLALGPSGRWLFAVLGFGSVAAAIALPINAFDPLLHFAYKGKVLFYGGTALDPAITALSNADSGDAFGRLATHPNYPFGIPLIEALCARTAGVWNARWVQLPLAFWTLALPALVHFGLRQVAPRAAALGAWLAAAIPMLYVRDFLANGYGEVMFAGVGSKPILGAGADLPVATLLTAACALLLASRRTGSRAEPALLQSADSAPDAHPTSRAAPASFAISRRTSLAAGLALAGAVMMKNEGLAMLGVMGLALALGGALLPRRTSRTAAGHTALALVVAIGCTLPWLQLRSELPAIDENYAELFTIDRIGHFLGGGKELVEKDPAVIAGQNTEALADPPIRIALLPKYFLEEFLDVLSWGLLWILFFLSLPLTRSALADPDRRWLGLAVLGGMACYFLILLVTPWYLPLLREKGIPERLLLHMVGPAVMLIAWHLRPGSLAAGYDSDAGSDSSSDSGTDSCPGRRTAPGLGSGTDTENATVADSAPDSSTAAG